MYKEKNTLKLAFSQLLRWKGNDVLGTIPSIRLSSVEDIYGILYNHGGKERVTLLPVAKTQEEKEVIEDAVFIHSNQDYH